MTNKKESFKEFRNRVLHKEDALFAILFLNPITIRIAYLIKKYNLPISANQVTYLRLFPIPFLIIFLLLLAPLLNLRILYLFVAILFYFFLFTDWLDGQIARGLNKESAKGVFLDNIADRSSVIIFLTLIFSIGLWANNMFLIYGSIFLFALKTFYLVISLQALRFKEKKKKIKYTMGSSLGSSALKKMQLSKLDLIPHKLNNFLKIKRWRPTVSDAERHFLTTLLPALLMAFNLETFVIYLMYFLVASFLIYFIICIKNFFKGIDF